MSANNRNNSSGISVQKFQTPIDSKVPLPEDLENEYFRKLSNPSGRRFSTYPAVSITDGKIVQTYGTVAEDVTHQFYNGAETMYCISPAPPPKSAPAKSSAPAKHKRINPETVVRKLDGRKLDLDAISSLDGNIVSLERRDNSTAPLNRRRSSASVSERQLGACVNRRLTSADTDLSVEKDKEILNSLRVSLKYRTADNQQNHKFYQSDWPSRIDSGETVMSTSRDNRISSKDDTFLYMTNVTNNRRQISKGELKTKKITRVMSRPIPVQKGTSAPGGMELAISGSIPDAKPVTQAPVNSYRIRQKYADDLERNWFASVIQKAKNKKNDGEWLKNRYDFRLDMFYSPEPGENSDSQSDFGRNGDDDEVPVRRQSQTAKLDFEFEGENDEVLLQSFDSGTHSTKRISRENSTVTPDTPVPRTKVSGRAWRGAADKRSHLRQFDSTDVLVGNVGELEESSASDIETVLHNGMIRERRIKHKMYRKRRRQRKRYQPFIQVPTMSNESEEEGGETDPNVNTDMFSVKQLRSMRLKPKKKKNAPILRGLQKFRQIANLVFIFVQFRKQIHKLRRLRRKVRKRNVKQVKKVKWNNDLEIYSQLERQTSPAKEPLHERFMREVGVKLLDDMAKLPISRIPETCTEKGAEEEAVVNFYDEILKVDLKDVENISPVCTRRHRERRLSEPCPEKPDYITFTTPDKSAPKKSHRKHRKRSSTPSKSKPKTPHGSSPMAMIGKVPTFLPPLFTPPPPNPSKQPECVKSPIPSNKHTHNHDGSPRKPQKSMPRRRSASPAKRRASRSPAVDKPLKRHEVKIWPEVYRPRSYSASFVKFKSELSIRELLKDADIPAKEVTIQIIERKRKRRRRRMAEAAVRNEGLELERRRAKELEKMERERQAEIQRIEEEKALARERMMQQRPSPFVSSGVAWNQKRQRPVPTWTKKELDLEITKLSGLFFELRHCSYIRWSNKDQAILRRLAELEDVRV